MPPDTLRRVSDVFWSALFGALGPTLVAVAAAIANVFGPARLADRARQAAAKSEREDARYRAAEEFLVQLSDWVPDSEYGDRPTRRKAVAARQRFVATLRPNEGQVARFTTWVIQDFAAAPGLDWRDLHLSVASERLFEFLRGERAAKDVRPFDISGSPTAWRATDRLE